MILWGSTRKEGTSEGAQKAWESRRDPKSREAVDSAKRRYRASREVQPQRGLNTNEMNKVKDAFAYRNRKFDDVFKEGNSEGAHKAWESRRAGGHAVPEGEGVKIKATFGVFAANPKGKASQPKPTPKEVDPYQGTPRIGFQAKLKKYDELFKEEVDYSERARRAWETRARGGETARAARAFVRGGKPSADPKVAALQKEVEQLKAQLRAKVFEASEKPVPKGKLPGLDTKQRGSLFDYFAGGGPKDKNERSYYLARARQIADGVPRPAGMSGKFGVAKDRVGKVEGMLYFIQKGWRRKNGV